MDINKLITRVKNILLAPKTEWPVIAAEPDSIAGLYRNYIIFIAAIPVILYFIKFSLIGVGGFGFSYREGLFSGIAHMLVSYAILLAAIYIGALIANALAANFGAPKDQTQALKAVAYAWTASCIAGVGILLGVALGVLIGLAGLVYAVYLLNMGLQQTMKCPAEKAAGYTALTFALTAVVFLVMYAVILVPLGFGMAFGGYGAGPHFGSNSVEIDRDSALGAIAAMGARVDEANRKMAAAKKSGDTAAQGQAAGEAAGAVLGAVLGGGDQVEALSPDMLKPFLPETLGGMPRTSYEAARNAPIGIQVSNAKATYRAAQGNSQLELEITDTGGAKGFMALAGFAGLEEDKQTDRGYEKTYHDGGRMIHEKWDTGGSGEYTLVLGDRFVVAVHGSGFANIDAIKSAAAGVNLGALEALKNTGVKKG